MPAVSGSPTQEATTVLNVAALESVEVASMGDGDLAFVQTGDVFYVLDMESVAVPNGASVLYTRNSNPVYTPSATALTPGRWVLLVDTVGCSGATGPAGPTGPGFGEVFEYLALVADTAIPTPGPTVLLTLPAVVAPTAGSMDLDLTYGINLGPNANAVGVVLTYQIGAGPVLNAAVGGAGSGPGAAGQHFSGAIAESIDVLAADSVVIRASFTASAAGGAINATTAPTTDHLALRARFFGA